MNELHKKRLNDLVKDWWERAAKGEGPLFQQFSAKHEEHKVKVRFQLMEIEAKKAQKDRKAVDEGLVFTKAKDLTLKDLPAKQAAFVKAVIERESGLPLSLDTKRLLGDNIGGIGNQFAAMGQNALADTLRYIPVVGPLLSKMIPLLIKAITVGVEAFKDVPPGTDGKKKGYFERFGEQWVAEGERTALREVITHIAPTANVDAAIQQVIEGNPSATAPKNPPGTPVGLLTNPLPGGPSPLQRTGQSQSVPS